jgi:hypothetical protein
MVRVVLPTPPFWLTTARILAAMPVSCNGFNRIDDFTSLNEINDYYSLNRINIYNSFNHRNDYYSLNN